jgi:GDPmannose 4,6-dehydratase
VTRKITRAVAKIVAGKQDSVYLGNLDARRDWGYAPEFVQAMWQMLQQSDPEDLVIATGETHTVREFAAAAFGCVGLDWEQYVRIDPSYYRPTEVNMLQGDASRAASKLGWRASTPFPELVRIMVQADLAAERVEARGD